MSAYIELHTASAFSFLQGASLPEALVDRAADLGYSSLALVDRDGVYGAPRFHKAALAAGIKPIIGAELTIMPGSVKAQGRKAGEASEANVSQPESEPSRLEPRAFSLSFFPCSARAQEGYRNLCRLITRMKLRSPKGEGALALEDLDGLTTGLIALAGRAALDTRRFGVGGLLDRLVGLFGRDRDVHRGPASRTPRRGARQPDARLDGRGVPGAGRRHRRRPLRDAGPSAALRRAHMHAPSHRSRAGPAGG